MEDGKDGVTQPLQERVDAMHDGSFEVRYGPPDLDQIQQAEPIHKAPSAFRKDR